MSEEKTKTEFDSTMEALRRAESVLPDFTSSYDGQIRRLYDEIVNRPAFRYDPAGDPLYQSYRSQMVTEGERAMRDTMGQAASLTGGYGSSYAHGAGQQEYERYLQRLGQVMPQLYQAAWERYSAEGDELRGRFDMTVKLAEDETSRAKDRYDEAVRLEDRDYQRRWAREQMQYQQAQASYSQMLAQEKLNYERGEKNYQNMMKLITQSGYVPSDAELAAAGMSREQAQALRNSYLMKNPMAMFMSGGLGDIGLPGVLPGSYPSGNSAAGGYTGSGYTGGGGYTNSKGGYTLPGGSMSGTPGTKEQMKLDANQKGSGSNGKHRRL